MAEERTGRECPDLDGLQVELLSPSGLPLLFPDPDWWDAWERWAQLSDRRDAKHSGLGKTRRIWGTAPAVPANRIGSAATMSFAGLS